ncbi:MAG: pyridoxal-phosphate dependent enzyme [Acidobacteria bacterium]|nr:pyridoxal-phosphate dependent enzyme [Acidobacteriota bacterium]
MPRLAKRLGLGKLFVKRDDGTGLAMGGNKARKLEYDFAPILAGNYDVVVTVGGAQSNHAAMTAAAARRLGLDVKLVLGGPAVTRPSGNMLLDALYGAEVRYLLDDDDNDSLAAAMDAWVAELRRDGRRPFALPIGGSSGLGALGYVRAMRELAAQTGPGPIQVVTAVGSCGTFAGLLLGARLFAPDARVVGISVSRTARQIADRTAELVAESAAILGLASPPPGALECHDGFHERYGVVTASGAEAIRVSARLEGLLLDPVYTGKSMAGLFALARSGALDPGSPVVFLHTGGLPILFAVDLPEEDA